ncbi:hypothetical protein BBD41_27215 [Paenibacillus ihbetae]|uniref:HNH domain-containing protein n=1 Tax=Paenibacillus ihbetae TaxID=1870820 RepID=A0A1B2E7M0_9BACL|nr:HNH endonuclease [Paenibacillus ihbetae]ANY75968.1 hypothetical protein BBD41_27215 [Paenibacillus ihbetae]
MEIKRFEESFIKKDYLIGPTKKYYIVTVKIDKKKYKFMIIKDGTIIYEGYEDGLKLAKYSSLLKLYSVDRLALNTTKLSMIHYKEDRPNGNPWVKDSNIELQRHIDQFLEGSTSITTIPTLEPKDRKREYQLYNNEYKSRVVYEYLFNSLSHRELDESILGLDPKESRGYQAMGILHHIGLRDNHKGIFKDVSLEAAILNLKKQEADFSKVVEFLEKIQIHIIEEERLGNIIAADIEAELSEEDSYYKDGAVKEYHGKRYERNPENRRRAIESHGLNCVVCGFNFEDFYGEWGKDFIEVHHLNPLNTVQAEVIIDPEKDLAPVCSNCHRMLHRKKYNVLSITELREKLQRMTW